ncbi:MAG: hypothetical protein AB1489_05395 [Acidobacteriota bacterium]
MEFGQLGLDSNCGESPVHCEECAHIVYEPKYTLIIIGGLIAITGLLLLSDNSDLGIYGFLLGCALATFGVYLYRKRKYEGLFKQTDLPLMPNLDDIQLREKLLARIVLDANGCYHVKTTSVKSTLMVKATFTGDDLKRLQNYRKKYLLTDDKEIIFHAGFAVLRGRAGLVCIDNGRQINQSEMVFPMTGLISKQPFFATVPTYAGKWRFSRRYRLLQKPDEILLSVHLVPSLVQQSAQQRLRFDLQWTDPSLETNGSARYQDESLDSASKAKNSLINRIELLELNVPVDWGEIENLDPVDATIGIARQKENENCAVRTITWKNLLLNESEQKECRCTFFVKFDSRIDLTAVIRGRVKLSFRKTLSGVKGVELYYPLGWQRKSNPAEIETIVKVNFALSLNGLRYQDVRIVPNAKIDSDKNRQETVMFEGVIPDHTTVIALTNAMNEQGFYVKRMTENPPHTGERSKVTHRYWDIGGRQYLGVYPIDFHLILTGKEIYRGDIRAEDGDTRTTLTVKGTYANPEMEERIENAWVQLNLLISDVLKNLHRSKQTTCPAVDPINTEPRVKSTPDNYQRAAALSKRQNQLDQLMESFIAGRLSEKTFLELKAKIEAEINHLETSSV